MKSQRALFQWLAMAVITAMFLQFAVVLPSVSAQGEEPPTVTGTPTEEPIEEPTGEPTEEPTPQPTEMPDEEGMEEGIQSFSTMALTSPTPQDSDCTDGQCVFWVKASTDDAGVHGGTCTYTTTANEIYIGQCANGQPITSGFRFSGVNIPQGTTISEAHIEFTVDGPYSDDLNVAFFGEDSLNALPFSNTGRPTNRALTQATTAWHIPSTEPWVLGQIENSPDLTAIVQEIVDRPDWAEGSAMAVILKNVGPSSGPFKNRRVIGYNRPVWFPGTENAARLVITLLGCKTDAFEPDDSSSTSSTLVISSEQKHSLCPNGDEDWVNSHIVTTGPPDGNLLVETFDLEPDSIHSNSDTQLTVLDVSGHQIGMNLDRGFGPFPGSSDAVESSRVVWHPAAGGVFNIQVVPEVPINEQESSGYSLRLLTPFTIVDPVDQASWGPTKVTVPIISRNGSAVYITQFFTYSQTELDALIDLEATLAWEFRRPAVDTDTGIEEPDSNVDYGDYWQSANGVCIGGDYWTNLPNHSDEYAEESNSISGCPFVVGNKNEEFELYIQHPNQLIADHLYYITIRFHIHNQELDSDYQFYITKVEYCKLYGGFDHLCNLTGEKSSANLIEGYLQPAP